MGIQFDQASSEYIDGTTPVTGYPFSVAVTFKLDSLTNGALVCIANTSTTSDWLGYIMFNNGEGNVMEVGARDASIINVRSTETVGTGSWRRIVAVFESDDITYYLEKSDGSVETGDVSNNLTPDSVDELAIGRFNDSSPGQYLDGHVAQFALWDRVLLEYEAEAYLAGVDPQNISTTDLLVHCPFAGDILDDEEGITFSGSYTLNSSDNPASGTPDDAVKTTEPSDPSGRVSLATDVTVDATLALPRYKIIPHQTYPWNMWAVIQATGNDIFFSNDWGATWTAVGDFDFNYHVTVWIDSAGNLHTVDRAEGVQYRKFHASQYLGAHHVAADDATLQPWVGSAIGSCGGMVADGTKLWISDRAVSQSGSDLIYVHYSGDNGKNFTATYNTGDTFLTEHRCGMVVADGRPALVIWEQQASTNCRIYLYRWDNVDSFDADTDYIETESNNALTRQYGATLDSDGDIHVVWADEVDSTYVIRHAHKTWGSSWSTPVTLATPGTFDSMPSIGYQSDGVVYCVYVNSDGDICMRSYGTAWGSEVVIDDAAANKGHPNIAPVMPSNADYVPILYTEDDGDTTYTTYVDFTARTVGGNTELTLADIAHSHTLDAVALSGAVNIVLADLAHSQGLDGVTPTQAHNIIVTDIAHGNTLDSVTLTLKGSLNIESLSHTHGIDSLDLAEKLNIAVSSLQHSQTIDWVDLVVGSALVIDDLGHGHTIDDVALEQAHLLAVQSLAHAQGLDAVNFSLAEGFVTITFSAVLPGVAFTSTKPKIEWSN